MQALPGGPQRGDPGGCAQCTHRTLLIESLGARIDVRRPNCERLAALLALPDRQLLAALDAAPEPVGGKDSEPQTAQARCGRNCRPGNTVPAFAGRARRDEVICRHDPRHPAHEASDEPWAPPSLLWCLGDLDLLQRLRRERTLAVVGAVRASDYGRGVAGALAAELAGAGVPILAPYAEGIGAAAIEGALGAGGAIVAVALAGTSPMTPAGRPDLAGALAESGLIIAEHPPGARIRRWYYPARSRLLAALADAMLVVEAEERSADLAGPRFAAALGKRLCAVPGRITAPTSAGTHALIREGAQLVDCAAEILEHLHLDPSGSGASRSPTACPRRSAQGNDRPRVGGEAQRVLEAIARGAESTEALLALGIPVKSLLSALGELEAAGLLIRATGGRLMPGAKSARARVGRPRGSSRRP